MKIGFAALILSSFFGSNQSFSQTDSTDLTLTMSAPVLETTEDSIFYPEEFFGELSMEIELDSPSDISSFQVELSVEGARAILYRRIYSYDELVSLGFLEEGTVTLSFGNQDMANAYKVTIALGNEAGELGKTIQKTITP